ncbi:MAG: DUF1080 domain-containing protein, partial [Planctomycetaceae bacterium]
MSSRCLFAVAHVACVSLSLLAADRSDRDSSAKRDNRVAGSLFNGRDLTGWQGDGMLWSVEDGCITGRTNGPGHLKYNKFLIWEGKVADFVFECEFRLEGNNNSGVQYRSRHDTERGDWVVVGYQADIHGNPAYTGMLYDEKGRGIVAKRGEKVVIRGDGQKEVSKLDRGDWPAEDKVEKVDLTKWHKLGIIAIGNRSLHFLDGKLAADITDEQESERELEGVLALQVHRGPAMKAQFRNLKLTDLEGESNVEDFLKSSQTHSSVFGSRDGKLNVPSAAATKKTRPKKIRPEKAEPKWLWLNAGDGPAQNVYFRREFSSTGVVAVRLYAACDDVMKIFVDGKPVGESSTWEKPLFVDLSRHLDLESPQKNHVLTVEAHNGKSSAGLLVKIDFESGWRDAWSIVSDDAWQASRQQPADGWKNIGFRSPPDFWQRPQVVAELGAGPWATAINATTLAAAAPLSEPTATPVKGLKVATGFHVELLYSVPKKDQGSWVNMCMDPQGRIIVSDQYGALYRVTPAQIGAKSKTRVEKIQVDIGEAQGLLWAF